MKKFLSNIKEEGKYLTSKSKEELNILIQRVQKRIKKEPLENVMVEWFALTQEVAFREIGLKHYDTQLLAGLLLHEGKIVEMKTGEGKTLASTLPVALNALTKKGVHVVTVNDYLAERDQKWMGKVYRALDLTVGLVKSNSQFYEKQESYKADITYVTNSELVFDYLRDSSAYNIGEIVQRPFNYCIIDEIDSILIDEARTPLILSTITGDTNLNKLAIAKEIANILEKNNDFEVDEKRRDLNLTEKGYQKAKEWLGKKTLYDVNDPWILEILNALKAEYLFKCNKDYIVLKNKILIVDEFTGRIMEDRRWSKGIHEAIEAKERVEVGQETKTKTSITYQNFFTLYPKLSGMTGTAKTAEKEFKDIYNLEVLVLPTTKPTMRQDISDLVYQTEFAKWKAVLQKSIECFESGQPVLIGTASVEKSEFLSDLFKASKIPHQVLNAKPENVFRESEIVAQAGERFAITIATNMAGRGTDIILGGNPTFKVKQKLIDIFINETKLEEEEFKNKNENYEANILSIWKEYSEKREQLTNDIENIPYSLEYASFSLQNLYDFLYQTISREWKEENKKVKELGGLFVLGTERHETRRIDNQLRGRAGRQGDPGISQFFISLEDELVKVFGGENIRRWVEYLVQDKDSPLQSDLLTKSLGNAQEKVEIYNYEIRKNVFEYDNVLNTQRKILFEARNKILMADMYDQLFLRYTEYNSDEYVSFQEKNKKSDKSNLLVELEKKVTMDSPRSKKKSSDLKAVSWYEENWISNDFQFASSNIYQFGFLKNSQTTIFLQLIDEEWTEHIERMNYIRETINWRSYGQQNPLVEYNIEAFKSFRQMFRQIRNCMIYFFVDTSIMLEEE